MPRSGEVIDDRFQIEHLAGAGGMGQVYRARDRRSGALVALKVMHDPERLEIRRFAREVHVLATLSHPGVVRYIDSGTTSEGDPYLVMEWLEGETLSTRLQRTPMTLTESLSLGRRIASALGAIHRRGVVHRDIKPSNLFLRGGAIEEVALIDFGMARRPIADPKLTVTGTMLGTPGYVAPEQVYSVPNLDGRADIFSLGCVLYRCLSGQAPFRSHDALRMLLNGTPDQLPRLRELRPAIPQPLDDLVLRMLSYSPDDRPPNGELVATELLAIEESEPAAHPSHAGPRSALSEILATERRLMSLVIARAPDRRPERTSGEREDHELALRTLVDRHRGKLDVLSDGSLLVVLTGADAAIDLGVRAARCALALRRLLGTGSVVAVTGREVLGPSLTESELVDQAVELLESITRGTAVRIDELTSALVRHRFDTGGSGLHLRGELREADRARLSAGEPPAVGRDPELAQLETIFEQCAEEHVAGMVLVTGVAGAGKSRLARELLRRLETRGQPVAIFSGEPDALSAGAPLGVLAPMLRRALGLLEGDPLPPAEQLTDPFIAFLRAECAAQPVLLVLEDLQWGDLASLRLVHAALDALFDHPLMVLGLARNNIQELFPQLAADRSVQEVRLRKLSRRACEQLIRQALGEEVPEDLQRDFIERSEGHPAYLEEMLRAVTEGYGGGTPPAVLAMVQSRLEKLDPAARRVLRAASIFGDTFWRGGVESLLGGGDTAGWLAELVEQNVVAVRDDSRFPAEVEFRFRHSLVREVAYEMLAESDRVIGHWLAGQWLQQAGETDAVILGEHFERWGRLGEPEPRT